MTNTKTFRVFISSTFSDLKAERNALQKDVFPRLRELCQKHECRFQAIDLRWGISNEAAHDQQTMNICLEELRQCQRITPRPNFIILLGQRYGWCPLPPQIDAVEFETLLNALPPNVQQHLHQWYIRDNNAVPADYCLQPRSGVYEEIKNWTVEVQKMRALLHQAIHNVGWALDDPRRLKYEASATHQEIFHGALQVKDCNEHVFGFFRTIEGIDQDDMTGEYFDLNPQGRPDQYALSRLNKLQKEMCARLPGNICTYSTTWLNNGPNDSHLKQFCNDVYTRLSRVIETEVKLRKVSDPVDHEVVAHQMFGKALAQVFVGRRKILQSIQQYLDGQLLNPLVVHGVSGSGKSALMAKIVANYELRATHHEVIVRYIGATPSSTDVRSLLEGLCKEISLRYDGNISSIPVGYKQLVLELPNRLALATAERPILVILDSLDQLSETDSGRDFTWLPVRLDKHVKMIVTTLTGECLHMLEQQQIDSLRSLRTNETTKRTGTIAPQFIEVVPMDNEEGEVLLDEWLKTAGRNMAPWEHPEIKPDFLGERRAGRTLMPEQRNEILAKFGYCPYPLYLKLAYEEARCWKSLEGITTPQIDLAPDISGVISGFLKRLEDNRNHGWMLTSRTLGYLAASRHGLSEDELLDLLSADEEVWTDFEERASHTTNEQRLPVIVWARLFMDLKPYLSQRMVDDVQLISLYHSQVLQTILARYANKTTKQKLHINIAGMFERDCKDERNNYLPRKRAIGELAYHYRISDRTKLTEIYANISYFCSYVKCHNAFVLKADIEDTDSCIDGELRSFISNAAALLSKYPDQAPQLMYKELAKEDYRKQAERLAVRPWIRSDRVYLENKEEIEGIGIFPVLSEEIWIQANCVAEKKGVVFIYNSANKIKLLQIDDLKPCGEILLPEQNLRTIKKLLCDTFGNLLTLVYDNGEIEVLKTLFSPSGSILSTTIVHRDMSQTGKFGAISACSWPDGIVYQTPKQNVICIQLNQVPQIVSTAIAFDNRTLISCNGCNIPYLIWRNDKDYSITFPDNKATIKVDSRPLAVCQNGSRLVIATEEGKLLICQWPDLTIEKDLICRLPIVSITHTDQDFFLMTDRHGNIWSLDLTMQFIDNGRVSNDLLDDYPSAIYSTGAGAFYISNRKCAVLSLGEASHRDVMCIDEKNGKRSILAYDRNKGFSVSIGIDAPRPLIQSIVGQQYEFEFSKFKWAWNGNSSIAYTETAYSVTVDNGIYSSTHAMETEVRAILYTESLEAFLVLCYSGQLHSITTEKSAQIPSQFPRSETGNYRIVNCGKYICIVAYNVLCKPSERNAYSETVMTLYHLSVTTGQESAKLIEIEHIDDSQHRPIKHLSYHASSNALYLNRGQTLERWVLDEPRKHETTSSTIPQDYNRYQPICACENGIFYIDANNQLKYQSMTSEWGGAELPSLRTITFLSSAMKQFGYLIENGQHLFRFTIEE